MTPDLTRAASDSEVAQVLAAADWFERPVDPFELIEHIYPTPEGGLDFRTNRSRWWQMQTMRIHLAISDAVAMGLLREDHQADQLPVYEVTEAAFEWLDLAYARWPARAAERKETDGAHR